MAGAPTPAAPKVDGAAFAALLQAQAAGGGAATAPGMVGIPAGMPAAPGMAAMPSTSALGIEAMLGMAGAPAAGAAAPSRLKGDLQGLDPKLRAALEQVGQRMGRDLDVVSGHRTRAEQQVLYDRYRAGTGNLAAVPGTSRHESGAAADVYIGGVALADVPGGREAAAAAGLGFPVQGEAWHVEPLR